MTPNETVDAAMLMALAKCATPTRLATVCCM